MAEVIPLSDYKESKEPHVQGLAECQVCGHDWQAVAPTGVTELECPACHEMQGKLLPSYDETHWMCGCGNDLFYITTNGTYCQNCGVWQNFDDI